MVVLLKAAHAFFEAPTDPKKVFRTFDADGDGFITMKDFEALLGNNARNPYFREFIQIHDKNMDQKVSLEELIDGTQNKADKEKPKMVLRRKSKEQMEEERK